MRSLFRFLLRNYFFLMFLTLEIISLIFIISNNNYQRVKFLNSSNRICGSLYESYASVSDYFSLGQTNSELAKENTYLKNRLEHYLMADTVRILSKDSTGIELFSYTTAKVINNSANKPSNYLTLNKGSLDGIKPDMGIVNASGVVGVVTNVSSHFATGMSLLNKQLSIPAKIKKNSYFGSLVWDGSSFNTADLNEIPHHVDLEAGDTIVTSGYSYIFPEGIMVGVIQSFDIESGSNFYQIKVRLTTNFKALNYVDVIKNLGKEELHKLEKNNEYD